MTRKTYYNMVADIKSFYDLEVWKKSHELTVQIYKMTKTFPVDERFGIIDQLRRASSSVMANIAEGFARFHYNDKIKFYYHSRGSIAEVQSFLILAQSLEYIDSTSCTELLTKAEEIGRLINGLINSINNQRNL